MTTAHKLNVQGDRFAELDLLRFLAATAVVFYHYTGRDVSHLTGTTDTFSVISHFSKFGYLGVELFFMISGFVILASALNRNCLDFAISRATRLYPTYWAAMILTTVAVYILDRPEKRIEVVQFVTNLTMLNDYLDIADIDGVYWTLHAELKFYFCIFILIFFNLVNHYKIWIAAWLLLTCSYLLYEQPSFMGWFIHPGYSSYFIGGALFYLARKNGMTLYYAALLLVSLALSMIYAYIHIDSFTKNPSEADKITAAIVVMLFYAVFYLAYLGKIALKPRKMLLIIGGLTYPLYLVHGRIGKLLFNNFAPEYGAYIVLGCIMLFIFLTAYLLHVHIEKRASNLLKIQLLRATRFLR